MGAKFVLPCPKRSMRRDMTASGISGSNYLIGTDTAPRGIVAETLRTMSVIGRLGVQIEPDMVGDVSIPAVTVAPVPTWLASDGVSHDQRGATDDRAAAGVAENGRGADDVQPSTVDDGAGNGRTPGNGRTRRGDRHGRRRGFLARQRRIRRAARRRRRDRRGHRQRDVDSLCRAAGISV